MAERKSKDLYSQRRFWRLLLMGCALGIVLFSVIFTYHLARQIEKDEKSRVQDMAQAYRVLVTSTDEKEIEDALKLTQKNESIPVIWMSSNNELYDSRNVANKKILTDSLELKKYLRKLRENNQVVAFAVSEQDSPQLLYYDASDLLVKVRIYPYMLLGLVVLFLIIALVAVSLSRTAEQNQLWVGMAKETAHQLGTPLSSLNAWVDLLEEKIPDEEGQLITSELRKDIGRLELVADRFSKIGSSPALQQVAVTSLIEKIIAYMSNRAAKGVRFSFTDKTQGNDEAMLNPSLFEWVLENLLKNALDAMDGQGRIDITVDNIPGMLVIDVKDSGKGIPANKFNAIFEPGYSTKKRGWGLGLTLTKRIMEQYHNGKIFVKESNVGSGTTFRIQLRKDAFV